MDSGLSTFIGAIVGAALTAWLAYVVWFRPDEFKEQASKAFNSESLRDIAGSAVNLWFARVIATLGLIIIGYALIGSCWHLLTEALFWAGESIR